MQAERDHGENARSGNACFGETRQLQNNTRVCRRCFKLMQAHLRRRKQIEEAVYDPKSLL